MTEYDYWKIFPRMPRKVTLGDITVRDGFQHLEKFISTRAKIFYAEEMIFCRLPQHRGDQPGQSLPHAPVQRCRTDPGASAQRSFKGRCRKRASIVDDITITAVTIREPGVDRAIELAKKGRRAGPLPDDGVHRRGAPLSPTPA
jgi:hydroxymethylglutaryl-CoA lyase